MSLRELWERSNVGDWLWRRRRNQDHGYWENLATGEKVGPVPLDDTGHALYGPEEARARGAVDAG